ncbi:MAG: response regulator [Leptonema sp. (in: bacteria)]
MNLYIFDPDTSIKELYLNFFSSEFPKIQLKYFNHQNDFIETIRKEKPDIILLEFDIENPFSVFEFLRKERIPFIVVSHLFTERIAIESLKHGAYDFIFKKNLKYGYFKKVISRALLDLPRWNQILEFLTLNPPYSEFLQYDNELIQISLQYSLTREIEFPIPNFIEGNSYILNFLTIKVSTSIDFKDFIISEEELENYKLKIMKNLQEIISGYNGLIWLQKSDSITAVFHYKNLLDPILCALQAQVFLKQFLTHWDSNIFQIINSIEQGSVTYSKDKQNIYSHAINLNYHIVEKIQSNHVIYITETIYRNLDKRAKSYFFKEVEPFEGNTIYHFEYIV